MCITLIVYKGKSWQMMIWHKFTPFSRHCASVPCNVTRLVTWSLLSCCHPWWRDHFYPGTGAAEQKCCVRGWVTGWPFRPLVRPRLSQLVMASGNNYQCINILKVSLSKLMNSSNHAPWLTVARAAEISSRVGAGGGGSAGADTFFFLFFLHWIVIISQYHISQ